MGVSVHWLGFTFPLYYILFVSWRAFANRDTSGSSITSSQFKGWILLFVQIFILGGLACLDVNGRQDFVIPPTETTYGGVQAMNTITGILGLSLWVGVFIFSIFKKQIEMLPAVLYTWPIYLVLLWIDFEGCRTYVESYQRNCVIGGAGLCDGLMLIIPIHLFTAFLIRLKQENDRFVPKV